MYGGKNRSLLNYNLMNPNLYLIDNILNLTLLEDINEKLKRNCSTSLQKEEIYIIFNMFDIKLLF